MGGDQQISLAPALYRMVILSAITTLFHLRTHAQITSPGLGRSNDGVWLAAGIRQDLDSSGHTQSMTFIGIGRSSTPGDYDPVHRTAIWVLNQEFIFRHNHIFQPSTGLSLRRQNEYSDEPPYASKNPAFRHELRAHARFALQYKFNRAVWNIGLREDLRSFFTPDFHRWSEDLQLRSRFRVQYAYTITAKHRLTLAAESFFASSHFKASDKWGHFSYRESRLYLSYSFTPTNRPFTWSVGYMNNFTGSKRPVDAHGLMMDLTWKNIFRKKKK